jgi:hypothetical protein
MRWPVLLPLLIVLPASAPASTPRSAVPPDKMICRKQLETGTLAKFTKTCMTKAEWDRLRDKSQALGENLRDRNFSSCTTRGNPATQMAEAAPPC